MPDTRRPDTITTIVFISRKILMELNFHSRDVTAARRTFVRQGPRSKCKAGQYLVSAILGETTDNSRLNDADTQSGQRLAQREHHLVMIAATGD
jgi:hypothetical protein